ncbi:Protein YobA [Pseudomonas sp. MM227]|uniref:copper homeostasis periplasmic binding protein CopC n=1 Tax=Pseudomonas sp. MM227 TaxID=3019968 RepID=UPI000F0446E3|nr:copper homeostasis periplasmic binding protein CopC [Pseudomonas sp. MM227]CAI3788407.1 Protein YobA [Pseudomonas sp. MM227]
MSARKLLSAALLVLVSPLAMAHAHLTHPVPAADTTVVAPAQLSLGFSEAIELGFSQVSVTAADGDAVALQPLASAAGDAKTLVIKPAAPLAAGQYTVHWQVVSVDTHKSAGEYSFTVSP